MSSKVAPSSGLGIVIQDLESEIADRSDSGNVSFSTDTNDPRIILKSFRGKEIDDFLLSDCVRIDESSLRGQVECFAVRSRKLRVTIYDRNQNCREVMNELYERLKVANEPIRTPAPSQIDEMTRKLLKKISHGERDRADHYARELAGQRVQLVLSLDAPKHVHKETEPTTQPVKIFRVKICLESLTETNHRGEVFNISIAEHTTIDQLKHMIEVLVGIERERQFWFTDRACLPDSYAFGGDSSPFIGEDTIVYLLISPRISS